MATPPPGSPSASTGDGHAADPSRLERRSGPQRCACVCRPSGTPGGPPAAHKANGGRGGPPPAAGGEATHLSAAPPLPSAEPQPLPQAPPTPRKPASHSSHPGIQISSLPQMGASKPSTSSPLQSLVLWTPPQLTGASRAPWISPQGSAAPSHQTAAEGFHVSIASGSPRLGRTGGLSPSQP